MVSSLLTEVTTMKGRKRKFSSVLVSSNLTMVTPYSVSRDLQTSIAAALKNICQFSPSEIVINKGNFLGKGAYAKCYHGTVGPLNACIKVFRKGPQYMASFTNEAYILSHC